MADADYSELIHEVGTRCNLHEVTGKSYQRHFGERSVEHLVRDMADEIIRLQKNQKEIFRDKTSGDNIRAARAEERVLKLQKVVERYRKNIGKMKWACKYVADNEDRSVVLTALHYVWCLGYCRAPLESMTPLLIESAETHVSRMKAWWKKSRARNHTPDSEWQSNVNKFGHEEASRIFGETGDRLYEEELKKNKEDLVRVKEDKKDLVLRTIEEMERDIEAFEKEMGI